MEIIPTNQTIVSSTNNTNANTIDSGSALDINDFFKLITAQMQNQSMYDPVDDTQFMAQMAQFTTLQQIKELGTTFQSTYAVSFIGKNIKVNSIDESGKMQEITGTVDKITFKDGQAELYVNGNYYKTSDIIEVIK